MHSILQQFETKEVVAFPDCAWSICDKNQIKEGKSHKSIHIFDLSTRSRAKRLQEVLEIFFQLNLKFLHFEGLEIIKIA